MRRFTGDFAADDPLDRSRMGGPPDVPDPPPRDSDTGVQLHEGRIMWHILFNITVIAVAIVAVAALIWRSF